MQREYKKQGFFRFTPAEGGGARELWCMKPGEGGINTICRVLEVSPRELTMKDGKRIEILEGVIADYTAKMPFFSWVAAREELKQDRVILIENAYVRRWSGLVTLYIGRNTELRERNIYFPTYDELNKPQRRDIGDIIRCQGAFDVIVEGDIVGMAGDRVLVDDGTGVLFMALDDDSGVKRLSLSLSFGTPVIARGNVMVRGSEYILMARELKIKDDKHLLEELMEFMARYTCIMWMW
ncbi:MAG: hypothetical protein J7J01_05755 [Methanophagales archaeon]|nr:hypothetical protein [Methanophagales archaeon]